MYFGSVRFFRHLIIAVVIVILLIPVFLAVFFGLQCSVIKKELRETKQIIAGLDAVTPDELNEATDRLRISISEMINGLKDEIDELLNDQVPVIEQSFDETIIGMLDEFREEASDPIITQLDTLQKRLDESMAVQATILREQMSSDRADDIEQQLAELTQCQESMEEYIEYIDSAIRGFIGENEDNP